jgi:hypothetical protein
LDRLRAMPFRRHRRRFRKLNRPTKGGTPTAKPIRKSFPSKVEITNPERKETRINTRVAAAPICACIRAPIR